MDAATTQPTWQCVMILWGQKYGPGIVNHTVEAVLRHAATPPRFVLITDRDRPGLHPAVTTVPFDPWFLKPELMKEGCQAKLVMFEAGVVPDDLPAIYLDLDTAVFGDVTPVFAMMDSPKTLMMLQSVVLPFGPLARLIWRITEKRKYARGNSSVVVYHPRECTYIATHFRELWEAHGGLGIRPMIADERFMAWAAQAHVKRLPKSFAVKFSTEYMFPLKAWVRFKARLPWVRRRRANLVAVTMPGPLIKPERLLAYREGDEVKDNKDRWLIWSRTTLGDMGERLQSYYASLSD